MTTIEVKNFLKSPNRTLKIIALSYVSLGELESIVVDLRYFELLTQPKVVERIPMVYAEKLGITLEKAIEKYTYSINSIYRIEKSALEKCAEIWESIRPIKDMIEAAQ